MGTLAMPFERRSEYALGRSFVLALLVHVLLAAVLFLGVRWQVQAPDTVTVDLVDAPPPPAAVEPPKPAPKLKVEPPPPPKPEPKIEPKPEPKVEKPDIALLEKPKPKPKPEPKVEPKPRPKPKVEAKPKPDPEFQRRLQEQVAREQAALEERERERQLRELIARQQAEAARAAAAAKAKVLDEYINRIKVKVRGNWILPQNLQGDPEAIFDVVQLPTGEVLSIRIAKSSGNRAYDEAVERAILKSSPLPLPPPGVPFHRELKLTFRLHDK